MIDKIINKLKKFILLYDAKHSLLNEPPVYICTSFDTRNRHKNDKYKIPFDQPQCPIFKDNRCCGSCSLSHTCDHVVDCGCYGFAKAAMGGTDERSYMNKCTEYAPFGRIVNGKFDWDYYKINQFKDKVKNGKYVMVEHNNIKYIAEIKSGIRFDNTFRCYIEELNYYKRISCNDVSNIYSIYKSYEEAERILKCYK